MSQNREINEAWDQMGANEMGSPYDAFRAGWLASQGARERAAFAELLEIARETMTEPKMYDVEWLTDEGYSFYGVKTDEEIAEMRDDPTISWLLVTYTN